jgi:hypothetical protein
MIIEDHMEARETLHTQIPYISYTACDARFK